MRENQRGGHQLAGLVAGVTEHDALVACALLLLVAALDTLVDVGRLFVDGRENTARIAVELVLALGIADALDDTARHALHVDVCFRAHLARNNHQPGGTKRLARNLGIGIATQEFVENGVGNLIRNLVGVPLGHRLRCKQKTHCYTFLWTAPRQSGYRYKMGKIGCLGNKKRAVLAIFYCGLQSVKSFHISPPSGLGPQR